jgi:hypothetical protein
MRSICYVQSAVTMRFRAGLTVANFALLSRLGTACRTGDSEYLFGAEFLLSWQENIPKPCAGMVNLEQF